MLVVHFRYVGKNGGATGPVHKVSLDRSWVDFSSIYYKSQLSWAIGRIKFFHYDMIRITGMIRISD